MWHAGSNPALLTILQDSLMVERVIDIVLNKTATAIFSFASGARSGGSIPSPATNWQAF